MLSFQSIDKLPVLFGIIPYIIAHICFSKKMGCLIEKYNKISLFDLFRIHMVSLLYNVFLPSRLGDVIKIFLLKPYFNEITMYSFAAIFMERLLDVTILIILGICTLFFLDLPYELITTFYKTGFILIFAIISLLLLVHTNKILIVVEKIITKASILFFVRKIAKLIKEINLFLKMIINTKFFLHAILFCLFGWLLMAFHLKLIFYAFNLTIKFSVIILFMVVTQLGTAIPSMPASLGVYHSVAVVCLSYWGIEYNLSLAFAIISHAVAVVVQISGGLISQLIYVYRYKRSTNVLEVI